jgi:glucose-6-phosphate 1-dehydrogenase
MVADTKADALVSFGATGDLAYQQIFPALPALALPWHLRPAGFVGTHMAHADPRNSTITNAAIA